MAQLWMIKVWWADGRITVQTFDSRSQAFDVISGECHPFDRYELVGGPVTVELQAKVMCAALSARAEVFEKNNGKAPLYRDFGFEVGRKYARIFWTDRGGSRSALAFVDVDGVVRRSDSWKKAGRVLGKCLDVAVIAHVGGPV